MALFPILKKSPLKYSKKLRKTKKPKKTNNFIKKLSPYAGADLQSVPYPKPSFVRTLCKQVSELNWLCTHYKRAQSRDTLNYFQKSCFTFRKKFNGFQMFN